MQELVAKCKLPNFILGADAVTILAGGFAYWHDWDAFGSLGDFLNTTFGVVLTVGAVLAIVGWVIGLLRVKPLTNQAIAMAGRLGAAGTPPSPEDVAKLQGLQKQARQFAITVLVLLVISVLAMATARYW